VAPSIASWRGSVSFRLSPRRPSASAPGPAATATATRTSPRGDPGGSGSPARLGLARLITRSRSWDGAICVDHGGGRVSCPREISAGRCCRAPDVQSATGNWTLPSPTAQVSFRRPAVGQHARAPAPGTEHVPGRTITGRATCSTSSFSCVIHWPPTAGSSSPRVPWIASSAGWRFRFGMACSTCESMRHATTKPWPARRASPPFTPRSTGLPGPGSCRGVGRAGAAPGASTPPTGDGPLAVLTAAAAALDRFGDGVIESYIVSETEGADDILAAMLLSREAGLIEPVAAGRASGWSLCSRPRWDPSRRGHPRSAALRPLLRRLVNLRGDLQEVMLGTRIPPSSPGSLPGSGSCSGRPGAFKIAPPATGAAAHLLRSGGTIGRGGGPTARRSWPSPSGRSTARSR